MIQKKLQDQDIEPEHFEGRNISMWTKKGHSEKCISSSEQVKNYANSFSRGQWSTFLGPGDEEKWYRTHTNKPERKWDSIATEMVGHFKETGHPVFTSMSAF